MLGALVIAVVGIALIAALTRFALAIDPWLNGEIDEVNATNRD